MNVRRSACLFAAVALTTSLFTACGSGESSDPDAIKFGFLIGITGDYASHYKGSAVGANIAIDEINAAGGVLDRSVTLVTQDNLSTVEGAVQGFSRLIDVENVVAIGGVESDGAMAIFDSAQEQHVPVMCPVCGTSELDKRGGKYMFRLTGSDTDGGIIAAQFARDAGYKNVSLLIQNTEGAAGPAKVFSDVFSDVIGGKVSAEVRFNPGAASYQTEVNKAFASKPDAVYVGAGPEAGTVLLREWERRGAPGKLFTSPDLVVPEIAKLAKDFDDGALVGAFASYDTSTPAYKSYAAKFEKETGGKVVVGVGDALQYDQYIALALAIAQAGTTEGTAIAAAVPKVLNPEGTVVYSYKDGLAELAAGNDINYQGASSSLDLNEYGNLSAPIFSEQHVIDGEWQEVRSIELDEKLKEQYSSN